MIACKTRSISIIPNIAVLIPTETTYSYFSCRCRQWCPALLSSFQDWSSTAVGQLNPVLTFSCVEPQGVKSQHLCTSACEKSVDSSTLRYFCPLVATWFALVAEARLLDTHILRPTKDIVLASAENRKKHFKKKHDIIVDNGVLPHWYSSFRYLVL